MIYALSILILAGVLIVVWFLGILVWDFIDSRRTLKRWLEEDEDDG